MNTKPTLQFYTLETKYSETMVDRAGWILIVSQLDNLCMRMRKENVLLPVLHARCRILHHCRSAKALKEPRTSCCGHAGELVPGVEHLDDHARSNF